MFGFLFSFLNEVSASDAKTKASKKRVGVLCKDEKDQKPLLEQPKPMKSKAKKRVSFETNPLVYGDVKNGNELKAAELKVKILMTKEEAARLLAKCKDGGRLEFKDVARELVQIPINRVNLVSSRDHHSFIEGIDQKVL